MQNVTQNYSGTIAALRAVENLACEVFQFPAGRKLAGPFAWVALVPGTGVYEASARGFCAPGKDEFEALERLAMLLEMAREALR